MASQPDAVRIARSLVGPGVRAVDVVSVRPDVVSVRPAGAGGPPGLVELTAHRSARLFEVAMPQPECPWLIQAVWALAEGGEVLLVPGSHLSRQAAPGTDDVASSACAVKLPAGSVCTTHSS